MGYYSHSRLNTFQQCPHRYWLHYIEKPEIEKVEGVETFMGSRVHEALEKLYKELNLGKRNSLEELLAFYDEIWERNWHDNVRVVKPECTEMHYKGVGVRCLRDYYNRYFPFTEGKTIATEMKVSLELGREKKYPLVGVIDRVVALPDGTYEIHDYKTSQSLPTQQEVDEDRQLALYQLALLQKWPAIENVRLVWHYLVFDCELRSARTREQLEKMESEVVSVIRAAEKARAENDFPANKSPLCAWCEYHAFCPHFRHEEKTAALPANEFLKEPGVVLVNKYERLKKREDELKEERKKLEQALLKYMEENRISAVGGSNARLIAKVYENFSFPARDTDERKELELLLQEAGCWGEAASLDTWKLSAMLKANDLPEGLREKVREYAQEVKRPWFKLNAMKTNPRRVKLYTDGGARGNTIGQSPAAIGIVLYREDGKELLRYRQFIGPATNNEAEYSALIRGLELAGEQGALEVEVYSDSELLVRQMQGNYKVKNERLKEMFRKARELAGEFEKVTYTHMEREHPRMKIADKLVNDALDREEGKHLGSRETEEKELEKREKKLTDF